MTSLKRLGGGFGSRETEMGGDEAGGDGGVAGRTLLVGPRPVSWGPGDLPLARQRRLTHRTTLLCVEEAEEKP